MNKQTIAGDWRWLFKDLTTEFSAMKNERSE